MVTNPSSYARFLNAMPDTPDVDVYINGHRLRGGFAYGEFTGYFAAYPGIYSLEARAADDTAPVLAQNFEMDEAESYTLALTGLMGDLSVAVIPDYRAEYDDSKAHMRFINLAPHYTDFDIELGGERRLTALAYAETSGYLPLESVTELRFINTGTDDVALSTPAPRLNAGELYSCYIMGIEGVGHGLQTLAVSEDAFRLHDKRKIVQI